MLKRMKRFQTGVAIDPDATALSFILSGEHYKQPVQIKYRDLLTKITQTANLFYDLGVKPDEVISFLLPNLIETHYILWGGEAAGIINPINPLLESSTIRDICQGAKTKVLVTLGEFPGTDIWDKAMAVRESLPDLKGIVRVIGPSDEKNGIYGYHEVIERYHGDKLDSGRDIDPEDKASILHTGGTTGTPKLAPRTHMNEIAMACMFESTKILSKGQCVLGGLPLFHNYAIMVTGLFAFSKNAHVVITSPMGFRDPSVIENIYKIIEHYRVSIFATVPTVISMLLEVPKGDADISSLKLVGSGAAPLSMELCQRFEKYAGIKIIEGYGLTEGTTGSCLNPYHGKRKLGSIGLRMPYQEMKVFVLDDEDRFLREAETDEIGAICLRGPNIFKGYLDETHNRGLWPKESWLNTGDMGRQDADGYFWVTGRKKELIIRGGHNIDPAAIEDPLYRLPGIQLAAAVGRPDKHAGEVPVAYVQLQDGVNLTQDQIVDHLQVEVGERAAIPKEIRVIDQIPLTTVGKVFKPALRWDAIKRVYESELKALGETVESVEVRVDEDKVHGSLATIIIKGGQRVPAKDIETRVNEILAPYTIKYRIEVIS
jgi:fatty-acyl-CoA synthase